MVKWEIEDPGIYNMFAAEKIANQLLIEALQEWLVKGEVSIVEVTRTLYSGGPHYRLRYIDSVESLA